MIRTGISTAIAAVVLFAAACPLEAQTLQQTVTDSYTRYELLDPMSQSFRILYDVTAATPGMQRYFNVIRRGAEPEVHGVYDLETGQKLPWTLVDGTYAGENGLDGANPERTYIMVTLGRPIPRGGEARIRIDKTYRDTTSYSGDADAFVFSRSLSIKRNAVVLPEDFELTGCTYPSQVITEPDGRIKVSFMNPGAGAVLYTVRARRLPEIPGIGAVEPAEMVTGQPAATRTRTVPATARVGYSFSERAFEDREIVYFLEQPETHSFRLYHDYTETREGVDRYLNVVRGGSSVSDPSAVMLDTGEKLRVETLQGDEITERGVDIGSEVTPETEVVVIWFDPVRAGHSARLRIEETYTDPGRYLLAGDELVWDRSFGRSRNTVILPEGWRLTANSVPAVIGMTEDGRIRLEYVNDRPGNIDVFIKAKRR